jgi:hypothetical protein
MIHAYGRAPALVNFDRDPSAITIEDVKRSQKGPSADADAAVRTIHSQAALACGFRMAFVCAGTSRIPCYHLFGVAKYRYSGQHITPHVE